jgi:hypothetical protein
MVAVMNKDEQAIFKALSKQKLPPGWICEKEFFYEHATHLIAPERSGGVVVKKHEVFVQLPGPGPCSPRIDIGHDFKGRGWLDDIVRAAVRAAFTHASKFPKGSK